MLDVKKWIAKVSDALANIDIPTYETHTVTISNSTAVAKGAYKSFTVSVARTGCTPVAVVGIQKGGSSGGYCTISQWFLSGTTANVAIVNNGTASATPNFTITVLYRVGGVARKLLKALKMLTSERGWAYA